MDEAAAEVTLGTNDRNNINAEPSLSLDPALPMDRMEDGVQKTGGSKSIHQHIKAFADRPDLFKKLMLQRKASAKFIDLQLKHEDIVMLEHDSTEESSSPASSFSKVLDDSIKAKLMEQGATLKELISMQKKLKPYTPRAVRQIEVRLFDVSYRVPVKHSAGGHKVKTVFNQSPFYLPYAWIKVLLRKRKMKTNGVIEENSDFALKKRSESKTILKNVNLVLKPGKMYLILGPPASGKTSLLKAVGSLLPGQKHPGKVGGRGHVQEGRVEYNGLTINNHTRHVLSNAISYIDQIDNHAPRLTVNETFNFAFQCKSGGTHAIRGMRKCPESDAIVQRFNKEHALSKLILKQLGLSHVADTFVGNSDVRGVSGGQRRRVTVGEMMQFFAPIMCADEISTGLDSASTYDIVNILRQETRLSKRTRIISLLQPSPETFSLFDEVIVLMEGRIIFAGPIDCVDNYFEALGYYIPPQMDVADFLQMIPTQDSAQLFRPNDSWYQSLTVGQFVEAFADSEAGREIKHELDTTYAYDWRSDGASMIVDEESLTKLDNTGDFIKYRFRNNFATSVWLNVVRHFRIWLRDLRFIIANSIKNVIMGISVGAVFWQTDSIASIFGVLFQAVLFIMLGAMTAAPGQLPDRAVLYRHQDANFYPTFSYVIGRTISLIPQTVTDVVIFGSILYWMVGLAPHASNFFIFLTVLATFSFTMSQELGIFASFVPSASAFQGISSFFLLLHTIFCGFIVSPDVIPVYYQWLYWWNPLAWIYRALVVNEFDSYDSSMDVLVNGQKVSKGDLVLHAYGFDFGGEPFGKSWIGWTFIYLIPYIVLSTLCLGLGLAIFRVEAVSISDKNKDRARDELKNIKGDSQAVNFPFSPVNLAFINICYSVNTSSGPLRLLNDVSGYLAAGRMIALMGSSGAGKTTLLDVIALRKSSGTVEGEVRLNGHPQEPKSFRRCSGYVEQFDVQSPELTVRETVLFSALLRLDICDETSGNGKQEKFADQILSILEMTSIKDDIVGTSEEGGLSFEGKKRLSIAVELAASPSILFLDEPTSGLDSRAALLVMRSLKRIAETGRTVCATIHQPSSAVFDMFDDLLLMKKGGNVVYFGELGNNCQTLIRYFESRGAVHIRRGENPATWLLTVIGAGTSGTDNENNSNSQKDYGAIYQASEEFKDLRNKMVEGQANLDESSKIIYETEYARTCGDRNNLMMMRLSLIYWRSPAYNLGRVFLSIVIAFILSSVFITQRSPDIYPETLLSSILATIFISFIIIGVMAQTSVLPVMLMIRDVFYRQRSAGMMDHTSLCLALGTAEKGFICLSSALFCIVFYFTLGLSLNFFRFAAFWGFFTFNLAIYSYFGQAFMCLVKGMSTASILCSVFIGINNLFSGLIVRPQYLTGFWSITYWICPGHYVFEGLVTSQFYKDTRPVLAYDGSSFFSSLGCKVGQVEPCIGTVEQFILNFFGGKFQRKHLLFDALVLGLYLVFARVLTYWALKRFNYVGT